MRARRWIAVVVVAALLVGVGVAAWAPWSSQSSGAGASPNSPLQLLAHRGVHQTYDREGLTDETCTAERIHPPAHSYLENTLASMEAAFDAGAAVVEIDIAPSADDVLVVFHDWTLACRTDNANPLRDLTWAELSKLDIGYGYTNDGTTFPFRGEGVGLMPTLEEVFTTFPDGRFLINFKSPHVAEATLLFELVERVEAHDQVWAVYGAEENVDEYLTLADARGFSERTVTACLVEYGQLGFADDVPPACQDTIVALPPNIAQAIPGWPDLFSQRLADHGTDLVIVNGDRSGIDTVEALQALPDGLKAYIWTDRIDLIGDGG